MHRAQRNALVESQSWKNPGEEKKKKSAKHEKKTEGRV